MTVVRDFFNQQNKAKGLAQKNSLIKKNIIAHIAIQGESTLSEIAKELHISVPTATKLVGELLTDNILIDSGKIETSGGRRPNIFGLANTAVYFIGVEVGRNCLRFVITNLKNNIILSSTDEDFELEDNAKCLDSISKRINNFIDTCGIERVKILGIGICTPGRINTKSGESYTYFTFSELALKNVLETNLGMQVLLENDTRAQCYAEFFSLEPKAEKDVIYLNLGQGVAIGIIIDGKLYYGKSGFAGEFGHTPFFNNDKICHCGKKGCLETELSGIAIEGKMLNEIRNGVNTILKERYDEGTPIRIENIINAAKNDDNLSIELIEEAGEIAGKSVAFLINIFNPELVIIGGNLANAGDYLLLPLKSATNKYSLNLVYKDTNFRFSTLGNDASALGAAMLIRNQIIGL